MIGHAQKAKSSLIAKSQWKKIGDVAKGSGTYMMDERRDHNNT